MVDNRPRPVCGLDWVVQTIIIVQSYPLRVYFQADNICMGFSRPRWDISVDIGIWVWSGAHELPKGSWFGRAL